MKKLIFISIILLSTSCFKLIETGLNNLEKNMDDKTNTCREDCVDFIKSSVDWCDCMDSCLNIKDNIRWKISECVSDTLDLN